MMSSKKCFFGILAITVTLAASGAKAGDNSASSLSVLSFLGGDDATVNLTDSVLVPKGQKEVMLGQGDWKCGILLNEANDTTDRKILPRQIPVSTYVSKSESEVKTRSFVWFWNGNSSGLTYTEYTPTVKIFVNDKTIHMIKCVGPVNEDDKSTVGDLEDDIKPFDLGIPQSPSNSMPSQSPSTPSQPEDA